VAASAVCVCARKITANQAAATPRDPALGMNKKCKGQHWVKTVKIIFRLRDHWQRSVM